MRFYLSLFLILQGLTALGAWETAISGVVVTASAQGPDGRIYSCADDRALHCLDAGTGVEYWAYRPGRRLAGFTVVSPDGRVLVRTVKNVLVCVSPGGQELWRYQLKGELRVDPASDVNGTVYLLYADGRLCCLNREGTEVWALQTESRRDIFALEKGLLLLGSEDSIILNPDGSERIRSDEVFTYLLYRHPDLYVQTERGGWGILDPDSLEILTANSPLPEGALFPEEGVLITAEGRIVSGRKDWFIQALEAGEDSYDPYYQSGGNPLRSRGVNRISDPEGRRIEYREAGGNILFSLIISDPTVLNSYLAPYENVKSLQELMSLDYDYDLALFDILSEANMVSADVTQVRTDSYSRSRIYRILTQWGDLRLRESLLLLSRMEEDNYNLALIMDGLGRIGLDADGRSMEAIRRICGRYPRDSEVLNSAVINSARLARYNGGRRILEMMDFYDSLQNRSIPSSTSAHIHREMHSF